MIPLLDRVALAFFVVAGFLVLVSFGSSSTDGKLLAMAVALLITGLIIFCGSITLRNGTPKSE